jgi:hypothetical protein
MTDNERPAEPAEEQATPGRPEDLVAFGMIPCYVGGELKFMPTLKRRAEREWVARFTRAIGTTISEFNVPEEGFDTLDGLTKLGTLGSDLVWDLVLEYDATDALGGRDWLEEHVDTRQAYEILTTILREVVFPFVQDVRGIMAELGRLLAAQESITLPPSAPSEPASSSNGPSPTGAKAPTGSRRTSTRRS